MKINKLAPLLLLVLGTALTGCDTVNSVENTNKTGQRNMVPSQQVITDAGFNRRVAIGGVNATTTAGGLLMVQVELKNQTSTIHRFLYTCEWFDADGKQINNVSSASLPDHIDGGEQKFLYCVAPTPACKDFRIKFIEAK